MQGTLPEGYKPGDQIYISAAVQAPRNQSWIQIPPTASRWRCEEPWVHFFFRDEPGRPFPGGVEAFHYMKPPRAEDLDLFSYQSARR